MHSKQRNIIIDGWRGVSVLMVIIGHFCGYRLDISQYADSLNIFNLPFGNKFIEIITSLGGLGVSFFFVISGFLITSLLVSEENKNENVSLRAFYVRRVCRIMPAFYFYVATIYALRNFGFIEAQNESFLRSSLYICNFSGFSCSWWLAHTWSLAVEEQFYLFWPVLFVVSGQFRAISAIILLVSLISGSFFIPELGNFSYIIIGVIVALSQRLQKYLAMVPPSVILLSLAMLLLFPAFPGVMKRVIGPTQPLLTALIFFGTLLGTQSKQLRWVLERPLLGKVGLVSYSLYLWQQLSLGPVEWGGGLTGANVLYGHFGWALTFAFIPVAILSYFWIEKPLVAIGQKISRKIIERKQDYASNRSGPDPVPSGRKAP